MGIRPPLELNREYTEPNEPETIALLIESLTNVIQQRFLTGLAYRDVHVKGHAAVRAEFIVEPSLAPELRVGLFAKPASYPTWIRYSNANHVPSPDIKGDIRGMALKLMGVEGRKLVGTQEDAGTHDFLFLSTDVFLTRTARDFYEFVKTGALDPSKGISKWMGIVWFLLKHPTVGTTLISNSRKFASLLEMPWFSATPYFFGGRASKYKLRPSRSSVSKLPENPSPNYLRERLATDLAVSGASFDFMIQFQQDPVREPVENALVPWKEKNAPFQKLATLVIPVQKLDSPEQRMFAENLSMNPWHCLEEHRPIGGVNRVRRDVYFGISSFRHGQNGVPVEEPEARPNSGPPLPLRHLERDAASGN